MKKKIKSLSSIFSFLMIALSINCLNVFAQSTTYYIDNVNGDDNNNGTSAATPWYSFNNVNNRTFNPGDRIYLKRGCSWRQGLLIKGQGTANNLIEVGAYGNGPRPVIDGNYMSDFRCLYWENAAYCKVSNITVMNAGMGVFLFGSPSSSGSITVDDIICINIRGYFNPSDSKLGYSYGVAVFGTYGHQMLIRNCDISGGGNGIIGWQSSIPIIIENCFIHDAYIPSDPKEKSIGMGGLSCHNAPFIVRNNVLSRCTYKSDTGTCGLAFLSYGEPNNTTDYKFSEMYNCIIENLEDHGSSDQCAIDFEDNFHNLDIKNCAFLNNAGSAIEFLNDTKYSTNINFENCSFYKNNSVKYHGFKSEISVIETGVLNLKKQPWVKTGDPIGGRHSVTFNNNEWVPYAQDYVFLQGDTKATGFPIIDRASDLSGFEITNLQNKGVNGKVDYNNHPIVSAGLDLKSKKINTPFQISGSATDDGGIPAMTWEQISGPGIAEFSNINIAKPNVTLPEEGDYIFRLVASDGTYIVSSFVNVTTSDNTTETSKSSSFSSSSKSSNPSSSTKSSDTISNSSKSSITKNSLNTSQSFDFSSTNTSIIESDNELSEGASTHYSKSSDSSNSSNSSNNNTNNKNNAFIIAAASFALFVVLGIIYIVFKLKSHKI